MLESPGSGDALKLILEIRIRIRIVYFVYYMLCSGHVYGKKNTFVVIYSWKPNYGLTAAGSFGYLV